MQRITRPSSLGLLAEAQLPQAHSSTWYIVLGLIIAFTSTSILLAALVCHWCSTQNRKSEGGELSIIWPRGSGLIAENGVFISCRLKIDFCCCNPWWNTFQRPREPCNFYENMCWFILGCIRSWLQHGGSSLWCWGAVQGYRAHGLSSCSTKDTCFKAFGISILPPGIEPRSLNWKVDP